MFPPSCPRGARRRSCRPSDAPDGGVSVSLPLRALGGALLVSLSLLAGCGSGSDGDQAPSDSGVPPPVQTGSQRGDLLAQPILRHALSRHDIDGLSEDEALRAVTGDADCAVSVHEIDYQTVGGRGEPTNATAAVMVPSGEGCDGPRPVVLYARGTSSDRTKNMANVDTDTEATAILALFAARGFTVVAPNYTGYDRSTLAYHPYLIADAQADDMIDALRAFRKAAPALAVADSGQLFVTGYSQGGFVAMATHRAIDLRYPTEFHVTASAPMSGPYALADFQNRIFSGEQNVGAAMFTPMLIDGLQHVYGNIYGSPSEIYVAPYDQIVPGLLPSIDPDATHRLPAGADGSYRTLFDLGDGQPYLYNASFRQTGLTPSSGFVQDVQANSLPGGWAPSVPMALCYGHDDPTVFGMNTESAEQAFAARGVRVRRWDVEDSDTVPTALSNTFRTIKEAIRLSAGGGAAGDRQLLATYHAGLVPPFCMSLARGFFSDVLGGKVD
ncbi:MAG: alpha/beta fold hydrolase [Burkholderiaceae bacterium]